MSLSPQPTVTIPAFEKFKTSVRLGQLNLGSSVTRKNLGSSRQSSDIRHLYFSTPESTVTRVKIQRTGTKTCNESRSTILNDVPLKLEAFSFIYGRQSSVLSDLKMKVCSLVRVFTYCRTSFLLYCLCY